MSNRKDQGLPSIVDNTNDTASDNESGEHVNAPVYPGEDDPPKPTDTPSSNSDIKPKPGKLIGVAAMSTIHPRGHPRKPAHSKSTPHVRPKVPLPSPSDTQDPKQSENSAPGKLDTKQFGLKKWKRIRKFKCSVCGFVTTSQSEANRHYKNNHPKLPCPHYSMTFNNPSSRQ